ncbi:MAG: COX15/CtaA family protein [Akkermansiaceae bacterium]|nr:COX15/CtaA family protein [Verrucomicrobiales bacterium]
MNPGNSHNAWLHRFAVLTAAATLILIVVGGLVTSKGAGMAVPDWPTSYGYNMFALPFHLWTGGALYEHTHRLWASVVGVLVVALTRWLGGPGARLPLAIIGGLEMLAGFVVLAVKPELKGAGYFLTGIAGVVLLGALVWVKHQPTNRSLVRLGWIAFGLVQFQGLLGGLRVVLFQDWIGVFHAALAQIFFVLLCVIAVFTSRKISSEIKTHLETPHVVSYIFQQGLRFAILITTFLIFAQLLIGATMRHQHAGLAIPDFPLAYGELWPATDSDSILRYNQHRIEISGANPITAFQVYLHMAHRLMALVILAAVAFVAWSVVRKLSWQNAYAKLAIAWLALILVQAGLGAATIWLEKAADIATAHVLVGVLSLATGTMLCIFSARSPEQVTRATFLSDDMGMAAGKASLSAR